MGLSGTLPLFITCQRNQGMDRAGGGKLNDSKFDPLFPLPLLAAAYFGDIHIHSFWQHVVVLLYVKFTLTRFRPSITYGKTLIVLYITGCNLQPIWVQLCERLNVILRDESSIWMDLMHFWHPYTRNHSGKRKEAKEDLEKGERDVSTMSLACGEVKCAVSSNNSCTHTHARAHAHRTPGSASSHLVPFSQA